MKHIYLGNNTISRLGVVAAAMIAASAAFARGTRCGRVALHTWLTTAEFKDISVTAPDGKVLWSAMWEAWVRSLGREDPLEKEMATHSSILAWRIPWMEEPGGLQSTGSQRVRHN